MKKSKPSPRIENAVACFDAGFSCSQAVLSSFAGDFGLDGKLALKVAAGFGGGMGRMAETCGAVTGAYMVIGLKYGVTSVRDKAAKERAYEVVRDFNARFRARNPSLVCKELLRCDISTAEGLEVAKQKGVFTTVCPKLVRDAAEILEELL
jgi:C_GCAxxG_C_C family probable redox protein